MATKQAHAASVANATQGGSSRPKSRAKSQPAPKAAQEWVSVRISPEANQALEQLRAKRTLNNRIASKPTILAECINAALILETELMRENINVVMKRVGGASTKIQG